MVILKLYPFHLAQQEDLVKNKVSKFGMGCITSLIFSEHFMKGKIVLVMNPFHLNINFLKDALSKLRKKGEVKKLRHKLLIKHIFNMMISTLLFVVIFSFCKNLSIINSKSTVATCESNVSQNTTGAFLTVAEALAIPCTEEGGYEIKLLDQEHIEYLIINSSTAITIKGSNKAHTNWHLDLPHREIINLKQGNLTLEKIEFCFNILGPRYYSLIQPSYQLIYVGSDSSYFPSLKINNCVFNSLHNSYKDEMTQIYVSRAVRIEIDNCDFNGIGNVNVSYITMVEMNNFSELIINKSRFKDALMNSTYENILIFAENENYSILIKDCEFSNINTNNKNIEAALSIYNGQILRAEISGNTFTNCTTETSRVGALYILDFDGQDDTNEFRIVNNSFTQNTGKLSGAFLLESSNPNANYNFSNNIFSKNQNSQTDGIGQDSYLIISPAPDYWTSDNIIDIIKSLFNGSESDSINDSVFVKATINGSIYNQSYSITVQAPPEPIPPEKKKKLSGGIIAGIVVGFVLLVAVVVIIVVSAVVYKKIRLNAATDEIINEYQDEMDIENPFTFRAVILITEPGRPPKFNLIPRNDRTVPDYSLTFNVFAEEVYGDSKAPESIYFEKVFKNRRVTLVGGLQNYAERRESSKIIKTVNFVHYLTEQESRLPNDGTYEDIELIIDNQNGEMVKKCKEFSVLHTVHEIRAMFVTREQGYGAHKLEIVFISDPIPGLNTSSQRTSNAFYQRKHKLELSTSKDDPIPPKPTPIQPPIDSTPPKPTPQPKRNIQELQMAQSMMTLQINQSNTYSNLCQPPIMANTSPPAVNINQNSSYQPSPVNQPREAFGPQSSTYAKQQAALLASHSHSPPPTQPSLYNQGIMGQVPYQQYPQYAGQQFINTQMQPGYTYGNSSASPPTGGVPVVNWMIPGEQVTANKGAH
ncbi:MAG: hypothetical protein EZS28_014901 [Streblomastix strix]|uniref:Right handed beta helix domain-containing protein n=1 Tax=Streblomastix strix TaxID=222440 RepID=A0A5J4W3S6_9EUKA|nr:MAG: hypothetical protein EZS28_014901 [Streblomastix strix]